jgi:hypothetical protein
MDNAAQADLDKLETCFSECDESLASWFRTARGSHGKARSIAEVGPSALRTSRRADRAIEQSVMCEQLRINQCVVTPIALSHGCGSIALYTSPYLTPAG